MKLHLANLLAALDAKGMKQKDLAKAAGWSEAKASRLLNGLTGDVTLTMLNELASALGVSPGYLVNLSDVAQTPKEREILRNSRAAQARDQLIAEAILRPSKGDPPSEP